MLPCILGLAGPELSDDERAFFREAEPAGFILFGRNVRDPAQLRRLTDALRAVSGRPHVPILIDQEGGRVARLRPPHWPEFPAQARFGALYRRAPISGMEAARVNAAAIGTVLAASGINVSCLPVLDLAHTGGHDIVGDRAFGGDPLDVASLGRAVLDGLAEAGVAGVLKHMPGHGRANADSHIELPRIEAAAAALADDIFPFARLAARARIGMTAHVVYPAWDAAQPATLSARVIGEVIRGQIGFDGLLLSDDIVMQALSGPLGARGQAALAAGCDLVLHGSGVLTQARELAAALPSMKAEATRRLEAAIPEGPAEGMAALESLLAKRDALLALLD